MKIRSILLTSTAVLFCTASISAATIEHTWVSGTGSDSNPCTFASPCLTFTGALANTSAGGMITAKDAGDFGAVSIGKSVTIDGNNVGNITFASGNGINITSSANVTVQNLTINGLGSAAYGIYDGSGGTVIVDHCRISFTNIGIDFGGAGNLTVENTRIDSLVGSSHFGIHIEATAAENVVVRNTVIDASPLAANNCGIVVESNAGPVKASLQKVTIMGAGNDAVFVATGVLEITNSVITQSVTGIDAYSGSTVSVASSLITANTNGVIFGAGAKVRLDNNDIYDNTTAISGSGTVKTSTTNKTSGTIAIPASDVSNSVTF
jgi:hypothetical protein